MSKRCVVSAAVFVAGLLCLAFPVWAQIPTEKVDGKAAVAHEVLVKFRAEASNSQVQSERSLAAKLVEVQSRYDLEKAAPLGRVPRLYRLHSRSQDAATLLQQLRARADVEYAEPNYIVHALKTPNDSDFSMLWGLQNTGQTVSGQTGVAGADISAVAAWDVSTGGKSNVIGVVDTGIDYRHTDLAANVWSAPAAFTVTIEGQAITCPKGSHGFNALTMTCDPMDDHFHGTHVSGTIGAVGNNNLGVVGVNWTTSIMGAEFLDSTGSGTDAGAIDAIEFTIQAKQAFASTSGANVRVLSNSWGIANSFDQALLDEINEANTNNMLFVAAAGNNGVDSDSNPFYPADFTAANVIAVAATDNTDQLAYFSNFGAATVHLGAPGVNIYSTIPGNSYEYLSGTSMATPHVSGAAMLVLSGCPYLDTADLKSVLTGTVDMIPALAGKTISGGRLNVNSAIRSCSGPVVALPPTIQFGLQVIGASSAAATVTVMNRQSGAAAISGISASSGFLVSGGTCGASLAAGSQCTIQVAFAPAVLGAQTGTLTIATDSGNSPVTVALQGTCVPPAVVTPASLSYSSQLVGSSSMPQTVQITNYQSIALNITSLSTTGDFTWTSTCVPSGASSGSVAANSTCTINVSFAPAATGQRNGVLTIVSADPGSPHSVQLSGQGMQGVPGQFVQTGSMSTPRYFHQATLLNDGAVLVTGGLDENIHLLGSAELYNPQTSNFSLTANMRNPRAGHNATLLTNGQVLVTGGDISENPGCDYSATAELYDPAGKTFSFTGNMTINRNLHSATLLNNGKVLIAGGTTENCSQYTVHVVSSAELYDPATGTFTATGSMTKERYEHAAILLTDGTVLIIGGDENANTAELYDPATGTFTALGNMVTSRYYPAVVQMPNGKVLIAGGLEGWSAGPGSAPPSPGWTGNDPGQSAEIYDPATRTFAATSDEDGFVQAPQTGTLLGDGTVLVAGGNAGAFGAETHIYNPATATFAAAPSLNNGRLQDTATYLNNGQVLFIGGQDCLVEFCGNAWPGTYSLARPLDIPGVLVLSGAELYTPGGGGTGTTVTFSSSPTRSTYGQNVTLTATVVPDTSACTPSPGNMVFLDPLWNQLAVVPVDSGGTASTSLNTLPFGSWPLRVDYAGNTTCGESLAALVQTVAPLLTVTVSGGPFSYDGNPHPATCAVTWGGSQVAGSCALTYAPGGANVPVTAGTYSVTAVFTPTDTTDFTSATGIGSITILPAFQTITCQPQTWGTAPVSPCSGASGATITYTATWGPVSLSTRAPSPTVKLSTNMQLPATANVLAVATAIPNYALTTVDVAFTVGKLTATIGCSYKLQDGTTGPDLPASATYGDPPITFTCQSNVPSTIAAPQYAVTPSGTSWAANKLTLKAAGTYNMTVKLNNGNPGNIYTAVTWPSGTQNGSIQVAQAPLSVLAGSANWTYASKSDSKLTAKLDPNSHMVNGDRAPVMSVFVSTDTAGADKVSLSPSPLAGTYYTHVNTLNLKNYAVKYEYGTLTVNPATTALTVSPAAVTMTVTAGKSGQATVTVLNETGETLDIAPSSLAAPFGVGQGCTNVAGNGGKCQVTVTFSPIVKGTKQTTLKFTASESTTDQFSGDTFTMHSVTIKGTGR